MEFLALKDYTLFYYLSTGVASRTGCLMGFRALCINVLSASRKFYKPTLS